MSDKCSFSYLNRYLKSRLQYFDLLNIALYLDCVEFPYLPDGIFCKARIFEARIF